MGLVEGAEVGQIDLRIDNINYDARQRGSWECPRCASVSEEAVLEYVAEIGVGRRGIDGLENPEVDVLSAELGCSRATHRRRGGSKGAGSIANSENGFKNVSGPSKRQFWLSAVRLVALAAMSNDGGK